MQSERDASLSARPAGAARLHAGGDGPEAGERPPLRDLAGLHFLDFLASALAIAEPLDRAATDGVGPAVERAIEATRRLVATNTNLGMVLLLAPLAAVPDGMDLREGVRSVLDATTDRRRPGGLPGHPARPARRHGLGPRAGRRRRADAAPCRR